MKSHFHSTPPPTPKNKLGQNIGIGINLQNVVNYEMEIFYVPFLNIL